jgi:hypothetical protein
VGFKAENLQTDKADKSGRRSEFHGPKAKPVATMVLFYALYQVLRFLGRQGSREISHYFRVCVELGKGFSIGGLPVSQE